MGDPACWDGLPYSLPKVRAAGNAPQGEIRKKCQSNNKIRGKRIKGTVLLIHLDQQNSPPVSYGKNGSKWDAMGSENRPRVPPVSHWTKVRRENRPRVSPPVSHQK